MDKILVVDKNDHEVGFEDKMKVHELGLLHRAFSIFIFNRRGEMLLQKRQEGKYHSGGLWSNTCCSHQKSGELLEEAIHRRLEEEMGLDCNLQKYFVFSYNVAFPNGLSENEIDHVYIGTCDEKPNINPEEASDFKYADIKELRKGIKTNPESYTEWFKIIINKHSQKLEQYKKAAL